MSPPAIERLEGRTLLSAPPVSVSQVQAPDGTQLQIIVAGSSATRVFITYGVPGDVTGDGTTSFADLSVISSNYGKTGCSFSQGNIIGDPAGSIGCADLSYVAAHYGDDTPELQVFAFDPNCTLQQQFSTLPAGIEITCNNAGDVVTLAPSVLIPCSIHGGIGNDVLTAGSGPTTIWGGGGSDTLVAGSGNDTLVSVGDSAASLVGGAGFDSFWADNKSSEVISGVTSAETAGGNVHKISTYLQTGASLAATTATFFGTTVTVYTPATGTLPAADPNDGGFAYQDFYGNPLFSNAGPAVTDVQQGNIGDCYFLSALASIAAVDPNRIRQSIVDLGDGTYAVRLYNGNGQADYVRVDGDLPAISAGNLEFANFGAQGSLWVALMEKAFAAVRTGADSYASIDSGQPSETYQDLGSTDLWGMGIPSSASQLIDQMASDLATGAAVSYTTGAGTSDIVGGHAYMVSSVNTATGMITLYNPWGSYVTVTAQDALLAFGGECAAMV